MSKFFNFIKGIYGRLILKILGWKIEGEMPKEAKYVAVVAPHTSIMDIIIGKFYNWAVEMNPSIMVKKEFFFFPMNLVIKSWGGIPIDRKNSKNIVDQMVNFFKKKKKMALLITPEGTRALNSEWKTGFYRIAQKAEVPIYLIFGDFKKKTVGFLGKFIPTGNIEEDIKAIKQKYVGITGFHSKKFTIGECNKKNS